MTLAPARTRFALPPELSAGEPPEARGLRRDQVRLLVADATAIWHARFHDIGRFLSPGDLLVVNTSATVPAAVDAGPVVVHFARGPEGGTAVVELRRPDQSGPVRDATAGQKIPVPGGSLTLVGPEPDSERLWRARTDLPPGYLARHGRPISYRYLHGRWPLAAYQTVFAREPGSGQVGSGQVGSAEMPSAGRPFTADLVTGLVAAGITIAPVTLHTGVSSLEGDEPPQPERYRVPEHTARLANLTRQHDGRIVAVGTTVTRALETVARPDGTVAAGEGWTDLVLGPDRPARVVTGLVTGWHEPQASHLLLLEAVAGAELVQRAYDAAIDRRYLWHEFGDTCLLLA